MINFLAIGVNYKTADIKIREKFCLLNNNNFFLQELKNIIDEFIIVSTCNRTEIYAICQHSNKILIALTNYLNISSDIISKNCYIYSNQDAITHLVKVASGIDSMIIGETQILGQLKQALQYAQKNKTINTQLQDIFQQSLQIARYVRSGTKIGSYSLSVAKIAVDFAFKNNKCNNKKIILIGAGSTISLITKYLIAKSLTKIYIINRSFDKAQKLASTMQNAEAIQIDQLENYLTEVDLIFSATSSLTPILTYNMLATKNLYKELLIIDLAMPRDVEDNVVKISKIKLYSMKELNDIIDINLNKKLQEVKKADKIIAQKVMTYVNKLKLKHSFDTNIHNLYSLINDIKEQQLPKSLTQLDSKDEAIKILNNFTDNLAKKFMHIPCLKIKEIILRYQK